jgi:hypothetical protein
MKKQWLPYVPVVLYAIAWMWIMGASAHSNCSQAGPIGQTHGLCLARDLAEMSCFAVFLGAWTLLGGAIAKGKGRNPLIGWVLGLTLEFMGCIIMMTWEPRRDKSGRMIGWDEYKHMSVEERKAIRPRPVSVSPELKRRRLILVVVIVIVAVLALVLQVLSNLWKTS